MDSSVSSIEIYSLPLTLPKVNEEFLKLENFQLIIQVNGKVRGKEDISVDETEESIQEIAMTNENVKQRHFKYISHSYDLLLGNGLQV